MTAQRLDRTLSVWRIGDPTGEYPIFDATGSTLYPGRWNDSNTPVIYAGEYYSTAMLEKLVHADGLMPPDQHFIRITLPRGLSYEMVNADLLPDWAAPDCEAAREYGVRWAADQRTAVLFVPSFVARVERNVLINPGHPEFAQIETELPQPVWWDRRLFSAG
jgi:RES domain-containing protein